MTEAHKLTPREYAILNQIWSLDPAEQAWLDSFFIIRAQPLKLAQQIIVEGREEYLFYKGVRYRIEWMHCMKASLQHFPDWWCLISLRRNTANDYAVGIVRMFKELSRKSLKFAELE